MKVVRKIIIDGLIPSQDAMKIVGEDPANTTLMYNEGKTYFISGPGGFREEVISSSSEYTRKNGLVMEVHELMPLGFYLRVSP